MDRGSSFKRKTHPREEANIFSLLTFFYIIKLFKKGYTKGLENQDLYEVIPKCRSKKVGDRLEKFWKIEESKKKKPSLIIALWYSFGKTFIKLGLMQLVVKLTITIWFPEALSKLISYFSPGQTEVTKSHAIYYACVVISLQVFNLFFSNNYGLLVLALGLGVKAAVCSLIYRKSLKLNHESLSEVTVGKITTILNKDVESFQQFISFANEIWIAIVQTIIICCLIFTKIGIACWAGVTFFFIVLPLQMIIGKLSYNFRLKCNIKTDQRLELTQEVLSAIKIIKMYTWENYFEQKICTARKKELAQLHKLFYTNICITIIGSLCSKIAFFIFIMTYVWIESNVSAEIVFYILTCFNNLEESLSQMIPSGFSEAAKLYATVRRCETILHSEEKPQTVIKFKVLPKPQITLSDVSIKISQNKLFENVFLTINKGLNIIKGYTGSGKTTFLKTILQECKITGDLNVSGTISYASQEPWLFPSSIRNNILFGEQYCEERYKEVLKVCCLEHDLNLINGGDDTIVGERGINLSKGQQARINLARAAYQESDIYLLDDCLASLDGQVSDQIFKNCICNFLKNKLVIFVTNNCDYFKAADNIIVIDRGTIRNDKQDKKYRFEKNDKETQQFAFSEKSSVSKQVYQEKKKSGKVDVKDYYQYVRYGGSIILFSLIMCIFLASQITSSFSEKMMSHWVTLEQNILNLNKTSKNATYENLYYERTYSLYSYTLVFVISIFLILTSYFVYFWFIKRISMNIHQAMLRSVMNSTMPFFESVFIGNILTRFSKDCATLDETVPFFFILVVNTVFGAFGAAALLTSVSTIFCVETVILLIVAYMIKRFCQPTGRNLQRLHVIARSPMVGHVNSTLSGLASIRASHAEKIVSEEFDRHQDLFTSAHYTLDNNLFALSFYMELFSSIFVISVIVQFLVSDFGTDVGDVGLAINQSFVISEIISSGLRTVTDCENLMTSVERMLEYVVLEQEEKNGDVISYWPKNGNINFNEVCLNYGGSEIMLDNINFKMKPKEKLGIVGRTGAGKSSIISSLLRLHSTSGNIIIDGIDIKKISLNCLRSNISVIPQDPFLFSGTVRENLDPFRKRTDEQIWAVLTDLRLNTFIDNLNIKVDKGVTFSAGQKQLLCLARVVLLENKIVILDEASANVDQQTDALITEVVNNSFGDCTVIIIAHRWLSVMSCDKIVVLDDGRISEIGKPKKLLENKDSFLHSVIK